MRTTLISLLLLAATAMNGQDNGTRTYQLSDAPRYSEANGYGFDLVDTPTGKSTSPFFFSVQVPDGNYRVTVRLGSKKQAGSTTVRAESRRLLLEEVRTKKGEFVEATFLVNKRTPKINEKESVRIKTRERSSLTWDDKLTLEFNGDAPVCESIRIEPAGKDVTTVFLCGNSTVVDQGKEPWASWGQMIPKYFDDQVCVANYAESGLSANTFVGDKRLAKALSQMKAGDYIFVEFGHNDQKQQGPGKGAYYSFMTSLKVFVDEARARGAHPVFVTPTRRRRFDDLGRTVNTHGEFPDAMRWIANKENVPLIELNEMTGTLYEAMGEEASKRAFVHYPKGTYPGQDRELADNTHFNPFGAYEIAKCVVEGIKANLPGLAHHLKIDPKFNPAQPDDPDAFKWAPSPFIEMVKPDGN